MNDFPTNYASCKKWWPGRSAWLPGLGKMQKKIAAAGVDDKMIKRQEAIILSMNKRERVQVGLLNASRRKRIAAGSGTTVQDVNKLVKQYQDMARMMKNGYEVRRGCDESHAGRWCWWSGRWRYADS